MIKLLTSYLVKFNNSTFQLNTENLHQKLLRLNYFIYLKDEKFKKSIYTALKNKNQKNIRKILDKLFFHLFSLKEDEIDDLLEKFY